MSLLSAAGQVPGIPDGETPVSQVVLNGCRFHAIGGRLLPVVAGGDGEDPPDPKPGEKPEPAADGVKPEDDDFDKERALATIRKLRDNEKATKAQLKELEDLRAKVKAADDAQLSASERATKEASESKQRADKLEQDLRQERTRSAVERAAAKAHLVDPDAAYRLLDLDAIEYGDDGRPRNVDKLVEQLAKDKPYLVGDANPATARPGTGTRPAPAGTPGREEQFKQATKELAASGRYVL